MSKIKKLSLSPIEELSKLSLSKFCYKKLFEIEFLQAFTTNDVKFVNEIVETGKKYEPISEVYFITYLDVCNLIERLSSKGTDVNLPKFLRVPAPQMIFNELAKPEISPYFFALMTKLKIIETLYEGYTREVVNMQRRKQIEGELNELLKNCEGKKGKKGKAKGKGGKRKGNSDKKTKKSSSRNTKKEPPEQIIVDDYTEIKVEENETIFDYNVDNHLIYIVLSGFPDPLVLQDLIKINVQVSAIIDVSLNSSDKGCDSIVKLQEMFDTPRETSYLENTVWMKYRNNGDGDLKQTLEELLYLIKRINYIKRQHLSYIKSIQLLDLGGAPQKLSSKYLEKYSRILNCFHCELVNVPLIVRALVNEVTWRAAGSVYTLSDLSSSESEESIEKQVNSYQVHEEDFLKIAMKTYGEIGRRCYEQTLEYMKLLQPLSPFPPPVTRRFENRAVSTEDKCYCKDSTDLVDCQHLAMFYQMERPKFVPKEPEEYDFTENLVTYNQNQAFLKAIPKGSVTFSRAPKDLVQAYHMKEDLLTSVLCQLVFKAMKDYSCWDRCFCDDTKAILLWFHDDCNEFGVHTKIWDQSLRTPVCLRDFCRFASNDDKEWLQKYKLPEYDLKSEEECPGLVDLHVSEVYQDYQHLLEPETSTSNDNKKILDEIMAELQTYPKSDRLVEHCNNNGPLLGFDLGPKQCQLTGHTTIFRSEDDVKITIDTTRFIVEEPKCTINVESDGNALVFHKQRPSAFHFILQDGTIVSFAEFEKEVELCTRVPSLPESFCTVEEEEEDAIIPNYNDYWVEVLRKSKISTTIPSFSNKPTIEDKKVKMDDKNLDKILELFKAAVSIQDPIYKISTKPSVRRLKRMTSPVHLPLVHTLKRILFKPKPRRRKIGGYSVLNIPKSLEMVPMKYDFKIILPHGLLITTLPRNKTVVEVKQEHKYSSHKEQYRIFYANGWIVVKLENGTTIAYCSNGDVITLTNEPASYSEKCAKNTTRVFKNEDQNAYELSRRKDSSNVETRTYYNFSQFQDAPYINRSLLQFNGKRIDFSGNELTEKQEYYVLNEHDYHAEEVFFEREDGMKCIKYRMGQNVFRFPDGTKITSWPKVEKELIFVTSKHKSEGWVSVVIDYTYEHPDYVTVHYDQLKEGETQLILKDSVINNHQNSLSVSTDKKNINLEVSSDIITFTKACDSCSAESLTAIYLNSTTKLLECYDSYNKYLSCDCLGQCEISSNFIKGPINKSDCDHFWSNEKQKFFILNERGPPGTMLWKDSRIDQKIHESQISKNVKYSNYMNKLIKKQTLEFFTDIFQNFNGRFTRTQDKHDICLSKYKYPNMNVKVFYVTYRILVEFQNFAEHSEVISKLETYLESQVQKGSQQLLKGIQALVTFYTENLFSKQEIRSSYHSSMLERDDSIDHNSLSRSVDFDKPTVQDIIAIWRSSCEKYKYLIRNKKFPGYFHSDYYCNVKKSGK